MLQQLSNFPQIIKTQRLELRTVAPTQDNAETIFHIIEQNRDYLEDWQGHFEYLRRASDVKGQLAYRYSQIASNEGIMFGIYKNNNLIGRIRFSKNHDKECGIGYWLIKSENGHGYMSEALTALELELFKFGFDKIVLEIDNGNISSENVAKRNNYVLNKRIPMDSWAKCVGKCDTLVYEKHKP